jgi:hypothetical protein
MEAGGESQPLDQRFTCNVATQPAALSAAVGGEVECVWPVPVDYMYKVVLLLSWHARSATLSTVYSVRLDKCQEAVLCYTSIVSQTLTNKLCALWYHNLNCSPSDSFLLVCCQLLISLCFLVSLRHHY